MVRTRPVPMPPWDQVKVEEARLPSHVLQKV